MSSHNKYSLALSDEATADIEGILNYTLEKWGEEQQIKYAALLDKALQDLKDNPRQGRKHRKLPVGLSYYYAERHYIVYRVIGNLVEVARILHDQMDLSRHL